MVCTAYAMVANYVYSNGTYFVMASGYDSSGNNYVTQNITITSTSTYDYNLSYTDYMSFVRLISSAVYQIVRIWNNAY